jgi:hypothetical protein
MGTYVKNIIIQETVLLLSTHWFGDMSMMMWGIG